MLLPAVWISVCGLGLRGLAPASAAIIVDDGLPPVGLGPDGPAAAQPWGVGFYDAARGHFYLKHDHAGGPADTAFGFGPVGLGWVPVVGDWNGDGVTTVGFYDPVLGRFFLRNSHRGGPADESFRFGRGGQGWLPLSGDWDGDGVVTVGLYDPASGQFFLQNGHHGGPADVSFKFGPLGRGWKPMTGDWDGDGVTTVGFYDPLSGRFFLRNSHRGGPADVSYSFGPAGLGWIALSGDWDGDGVFTVGFYDPAPGRFHLRNSHRGGRADESFAFGPVGLGWIPLAGAWHDPSAVVIDGPWMEFAFIGGDGTAAIGCAPADPAGARCSPSPGGNAMFAGPPPWTFMAPAGGANLTVTDTGLVGEVLEIFDFGVSLGSTSAPGADGDCGIDPEVCLADARISRGVFPLAAGAHQITITATRSAFGGGAAFFRVDAAGGE